jgi:uncharacterized membrane protein YphA (DoxX/SURF4 family)
MQNLGARVYGLAAIMMGIVGLVWGEFTMEWLVPAKMPGRLALAYAVGALLIAGGVLINWRRMTSWGAGLLTALCAIGLLFGLRAALMHYRIFDYWDPVSEFLALTATGLVATAMSAKMEPRLSSQIQSAGRIVFGVCLFVFAAAHFYWLSNTASLVPKWLPPNQMFWAYATAFAAIAAGLAFISGVMALLAARLLTLMYIIFGILVHTPLVIASPSDHFKVEELMFNLMLVCAAWIVVDSLAARRRNPAS